MEWLGGCTRHARRIGARRLAAGAERAESACCTGEQRGYTERAGSAGSRASTDYVAIAVCPAAVSDAFSASVSVNSCVEHDEAADGGSEHS
jgi:hypothetical protein